MSIFSNIIAKIFPSDHPAVTTAAASPPAPPSAAAAPTAAAPTPAVSKMPEVDVEKQLAAMADTQGEKLNWRTSIVDLMKLLGLDSSLAARKQLATELNFPGDMNDSAAMNVWLQKQVMNKLAANGGKVPKELT